MQWGQKQLDLFFCSLFPDIPNSSLLFDVPQASPTCPFDNSSITIRMGMEHWWNDNDKGK
jgi:hypothetical protein